MLVIKISDYKDVILHLFIIYNRKKNLDIWEEFKEQSKVLY